ncbi:MAG: hypothetical protein WD971_01925 [Pirellulales bacterium]
MFRSRICTALMLLLLAAANDSSWGAKPAPAVPPSTAEIDRWIRDLGDDNYTVRKSAADRLAAGGFAARTALAKLESVRMHALGF